MSVIFDHVSKRFPGVLALEDVSFSIAAGTCHALCGENGAGKSTLGKILGGIHRPDSGQVIVEGRPRSTSPGRRRRCGAGIGIVHQELAFCDNLTVAENLCLGSLPATRDVRVARARWCGARARCWRPPARRSTFAGRCAS